MGMNRGLVLIRSRRTMARSWKMKPSPLLLKTKGISRVLAAEGLLDACANGVVVVLCLDDGDGDIGLVVEYVVSAFLCASGVESSCT